MFGRQSKDLNKIVSNMQKQDKSKEQIKRAVSLYLTGSKKKFNPNGDKGF